MIPSDARISDCASVFDAVTALCSHLVDPNVARLGAEQVSPDEMPETYRRLLVHTEHMTTTLNEFHGRPVTLDVLKDHLEGDDYRREIVLHLQDTGRVVELGIVRLDLGVTDAEVRTEILARKTPLGDILVRHRVLRRIDPKWYLRFSGESPILEYFQEDQPEEVFGRVGIIYFHEKPAVELLEVVTDAKR